MPTVSIQTSYTLTRSVSSAQAIGGINQEQKTIASTSEMIRQLVQIVSTTHELVDAGDMSDSCMMQVKNLHATAIISVGVVVASVFYPLFGIPPGERAVMPRATALASTYLKSDVISTNVEISLYQISA